MTFDGASSTYEEYSPDEVAALVENHDVLMAYDAYIRAAFDARLPDTGWRPACVAEFRETEYRNVWLGRAPGENPFEYMYGPEEDEPALAEPATEPDMCLADDDER